MGWKSAHDSVYNENDTFICSSLQWNIVIWLICFTDPTVVVIALNFDYCVSCSMRSDDKWWNELVRTLLWICNWIKSDSGAI